MRADATLRVDASGVGGGRVGSDVEEHDGSGERCAVDGWEKECLELCGWRRGRERVRWVEGEPEEGGGRVEVVERDLRAEQGQIDVERQDEERGLSEERD